MSILSSPRQYLFNLKTTSSQEAIRMWRRNVKEKWNYKCAYCGSKKELTIDHVFLVVKEDQTSQRMQYVAVILVINLKLIVRWEEWYLSQDFFDVDRYNKIKEWMKPDQPQNLFAYKPRRNNASQFCINN